MLGVRVATSFNRIDHLTQNDQLTRRETVGDRGNEGGERWNGTKKQRPARSGRMVTLQGALHESKKT